MAENPDDVIPSDLQAALLEGLEPMQPDAPAAKRMRASLLDAVVAESDTAALVTVPSSTDDWFEPVPGNHVKVLRSDDDTMSILVRLEPGTTFPEHYHPADEETFVVEGETWFGDIHLVAGDYHLAPKGTHHGEVTTETGCVLLIRKASE
ncbi:MAG: cupin domain-containing protein [Gammaproteobacteria bacterium]